MSPTTRLPPSPTALTPRKCFNPNALQSRTQRAWDRQPRATTISVDGKPRTIWKRFEGTGCEQDKENIVEEVVVAEEMYEGEKGEDRSPMKKAVKKMCLSGGQVVVKGWERRDSGLMREFAEDDRVSGC